MTNVNEPALDSGGERKLFTAKFPPHIFDILAKYSKEDYSNKTQIAIRAIQYFDKMRLMCDDDPYGNVNLKLDRMEKDLVLVRNDQKKWAKLFGLVCALLSRDRDRHGDRQIKD